MKEREQVEECQSRAVEVGAKRQSGEFFKTSNTLVWQSGEFSLSYFLFGFIFWILRGDSFKTNQIGALNPVSSFSRLGRIHFYFLYGSVFTFLQGESFKTNHKHCGLNFSADNLTISYSCLGCIFSLLRGKSFNTDQNGLDLI